MTRAPTAPYSPWAGAVLAAPALFALLVGAKFGWLSPVALVPLAFVALAAVARAARDAPGTLAVFAPVAIPFGLVAHVFPYEVALGIVVALLVIHGVVHARAWLWRVAPAELALLAFTGWGWFSGFWCEDLNDFVQGARRLGVGLVSLWAARRVARLVPRDRFLLGLVAGAGMMSLMTLIKRVSTGYTAEQAYLSRGTATDLGWGWANYIAALLLIFLPFVLLGILQRRNRGLRIVAIVVSVLVVATQLVVIARGALLLFAAILLVQLTAASKTRRVWGLSLALAAIAILLVGPWGETVLLRFTSLRELGSGVIRLWYFREGWQRTLDNLPWGIGLHQGEWYPDKLQGLDPHDYWLTLSGELGFLGPLLWLVTLAFVWRALGRLRAYEATRDLVVPMRIAFLASQAHTLVEPTFQGSQYQFLFFWIMGGGMGFADVAAEAFASSRTPAAASALSPRALAGSPEAPRAPRSLPPFEGSPSPAGS